MMSSGIARNAWIFIAVGVLLASLQGSAQQVATPQGGSQKMEPREGETFHVLVGKSVIVNVAAPLTRVLSSNPTVIETMATSPTEVVLEGKAPGVSSVILWDNVGHSQVLDVEVDLDVTSLRNAIQRAYPQERLDVEADGGHLVLSGTACQSSHH